MSVPDADAARSWYSRGVTFFETLSEVDLIAQGAKSLVGGFRSIGTKEA